MNSSGFWFRCAELAAVGLYTRGAARRRVPFSRSVSCSGRRDQTLVTPCACCQRYRSASQAAAVTGRSPSRE